MAIAIAIAAPAVASVEPCVRVLQGMAAFTNVLAAFMTGLAAIARVLTASPNGLAAFHEGARRGQCSTMKDLSPDDRPREKLQRLGVTALGDNELVALVLGSGTTRTNALIIANELLKAVGGLHGLARSTSDDLVRFDGVGPAKAGQLLAALELGRRTLTDPTARVQLRSPRDAATYLMPRFGSRSIEQFGVVLLDAKHRVLRTKVLAVGSSNSTVAEPRDVYREAMFGAAMALVVFHNHPSGDPTPSPDDHELTRRLAAAGALMGIELVDHIVLGDGQYCSFKEMGKL